MSQSDLHCLFQTKSFPDEDFASVYGSGLVLITTGFFHHVISNDDELAAILGNQVVHLIAGHILEQNCIRLVDKYFTKPFSWFLLLMTVKSEGIIFAAPIVASGLYSFRLSRVREREADYMGLLLMADAGFDPQGAVSLWTKVNKWEEELQSVAKKKIRQTPQFMSWHPHVSFSRLSCTI